MALMVCCKCGIGIDKEPLYRINKKGEKGQFACIHCCKELGINLNKDLVNDTETIHNFGKISKLN